MKLPGLLPLLASFACTCYAQDLLPATSTPEGSPAPAGAPSPSPAIEPPTLIPSPPLPRPPAVDSGNPDLSQLDAIFKQSPLGIASQEFAMHLQWRQLQNRVAENPEVLQARLAVDKAPTDLEKRVRLGIFYRRYFKEMRSQASSPELQAYLDGKLAGQLGSLAQPRVRPTPVPEAAGRKR